jgi:hypothetical protein
MAEKPEERETDEEAPSKEEASKEDVEKAVEAIYAYAGALLRQGKSSAEVEDALVEKGIERKTATIVVDKLAVATTSMKKEEGTKNMMIGGLICLVGIVITAATYSSAAGGGKYVIAWGAIVFGAIRFFRGLGQASG